MNDHAERPRNSMNGGEVFPSSLRLTCGCTYLSSNVPYGQHTNALFTPCKEHERGVHSHSFIAPKPEPVWKFYTEEEMITSTVFQRCLTQALSLKDKQIRDLQNEILDLFVDRLE